MSDQLKALLDGVRDAVEQAKPLTVEQLLDLYPPPAPRPQLARVEIGEAALGELFKLALAEEHPQDPRCSVWEALTCVSGGLFGVPLVVPKGMDPIAWRLVDRDGQTIREGAL